MGVTDLVEEQGRIVGVITEKDGKPWRIEARDGVLINAGGFARNAELRRKYGPQPSSIEWTNANPGDTGEMIEIARAHGAAVDLTDQAVSSEERRVGKECVSTCRSRWSPFT